VNATADLSRIISPAVPIILDVYDATVGPGDRVCVMVELSDGSIRTAVLSGAEILLRGVVQYGPTR
jgi:hypothetical protein